MALARIPNPAEEMRKAMPRGPSPGRAGVQTTPAVRATVNAIQPRTRPIAGANAAPPGRPPNMGSEGTAGPSGGFRSVAPQPSPTAATAAPAPQAAASTGSTVQQGKRHSAASAAGTTKGELGTLRKGILDALGGGLEGLYSPDDEINAIAGLKGDIDAGMQSQLDAADADAARRGLFRSGMAGSRAASIRRGAGADFSRQANDMRKAIREANMASRLNAAGQSTDFLRGEQDLALKKQQMRRAAAASARANAPIQLFNEATGEMESIDPRMLQFAHMF